MDARAAEAAVEPTQREELRDPVWYKDAVIYEVHVRAFLDSNEDGIGDFSGLTRKLDYIQSLGVNTIWLLPFYPSPQKDDGYDISDYHGIHASYGTRADFRSFIREAHARGLRVITELVINHTSDQHPWFQAARRAPPGSAKRDFYVWSDADTRYAGTRVIFTDTEKSNWTWDPVAKAYFWHRFFGHQPDLNFANPHVIKAVGRILRYWLDQGVDGLRLDAIPYLCEREGTNNENLRETHEVVKQLRALIDARYPDRMLLAEANQWPEDVRDYFGEGDECHMAYHFPLMPRMYMAIAQEDRHPIVEILAQTPEIPPNCQWAIFLRNHDELTLEMVTSRERDYMYQVFAADPRARLNLGIRRRLAPLMDNDPDRIKLMNSLLLSMPGSPIVYYGDEIGMGDNFFLGDRNGVRTPMQWNPDRNAGFSRADPQRLYLPPIMDPVYGYEAVNVEAQERDRSSLLNWMRRTLQVRNSSQAFGRGTLRVLRPGNRKILAYLREYGEDTLLCVANLARHAQAVELSLGEFKGLVPIEMMGKVPFAPIGDLPYMLTLPGHAFYWFRLARGQEAPAWHVEQLPREDLPMLVLFDGWNSIFRERVVPWRIGMAEKLRAQLELETLPDFLHTRRWYAAKGVAIERAAFVERVEWRRDGFGWLFTIVEVAQRGSAETARYQLPLALAWEGQDDARTARLAPEAIARVRQQAQVGLLADALLDEPFARAIVTAIGAGEELAGERGRIRFAPTRAFATLRGPPDEELSAGPPRAQTSNTSIMLGDRLFLKAYRRLTPGPSPEVEIGRFLTEIVPFDHVAQVAGAVEYLDQDANTCTLAVLQQCVRNQGDGWDYTLAYLGRFLEEVREDVGAEGQDEHGGYLALIDTLGTRTAQLHRALTTVTGNPAFDPQPIERRDLRRWSERVLADATATFEQLAERRAAWPAGIAADAEAALAMRSALAERIAKLTAEHVEGVKARHHGDYHLAQVLIARNDFVIVDFEGEPAREAAEREAMHSPLRDVAGMLRSFSYAGQAALDGASAASPEKRLALERHIERWEHQTRRRFLDAYDATISGSSVCASLRAAQPLLDLFEIEKILYEIRYELGNRPDWLHIPLRGLRRLGRGPDPGGQPAHAGS